MRGVPAGELVEVRVFFATYATASAYARSVQCCVGGAFGQSDYFAQRPQPLILEVCALTPYASLRASAASGRTL